MDGQKWTSYDVMRTPTEEYPLFWMHFDEEFKFTSTRQLMKYLRTTFPNREWKVISFKSWTGRGIEIKYRGVE